MRESEKSLSQIRRGYELTMSSKIWVIEMGGSPLLDAPIFNGPQVEDMSRNGEMGESFCRGAIAKAEDSTFYRL